ncbi:unnamed protein product [Phaedon cochleariae]|uniref:Uncharacterized protein n=1 Tax=Phaedon cochleariae TaxID=80249 RepID=A0A9P0GM22_PHACE|nr:unnamed protein product [Phaedon cochleariae]
MGGMGMGGMGMGGMGMGGMGMGGMGMGAMGMGGSEMGGTSMEGANKHFNDMIAKKSFGKQGGQFDQGMSGFSKGGGLIKDVKGDSGFYSGIKGMKNMFEDGSVFKGGQYFGKDGQNQGQEDAKKGHKKGHTVKGFKKSHQTDESSNTEEIYDEEHDEADKKAVQGQKGQFGQTDSSAFKGEKTDAKFAEGNKNEQGKYQNEVLADKAEALQGKFGSNKFGADGAVFSGNNGGNINSNEGHQGYNKVYKHVPMHF